MLVLSFVGMSTLPRLRSVGMLVFSIVGMLTLFVLGSESHKRHTAQTNEQLDIADSFISKQPVDLRLKCTTVQELARLDRLVDL